MIEKPLVYDDFADKVGEVFVVPDKEGAPVELALREAELLPPQPGSPTKEPFSLLFLGEGDRTLDQRLHWMEHPVLGKVEVFLTPIGSTPQGMRYEAVFN